LPRGRVTATEAQPVLQTLQKELPTPTRILVIDSDPGYGDPICDALRRAGHLPTLTRSPREAVERMKVEQHDVALIDTAARAQDGIALAVELRGIRADMGLVFMSPSRLGVMESVALYEAGADELIEKPFHPTVFLMRMQAVVRRLSWAGSTRSAALEQMIGA